MHMYIIKAGTQCLTLPQEEGKDIQERPYLTHKSHEFSKRQALTSSSIPSSAGI